MATEHEPHLVKMRVANVHRGPPEGDQPASTGLPRTASCTPSRSLKGLREHEAWTCGPVRRSL
jgi:hypothetical protein